LRLQEEECLAREDSSFRGGKKWARNRAPKVNEKSRTKSATVNGPFWPPIGHQQQPEKQMSNIEQPCSMSNQAQINSPMLMRPTRFLRPTNGHCRPIGAHLVLLSSYFSPLLPFPSKKLCFLSPSESPDWPPASIVGQWSANWAAH